MARILTVEQVAAKLQMSSKVVRQYLSHGKLPGRKVGKSWRVLETDLEAWVSGGTASRGERYVSARGFLRAFPGRLTSEDVIEEKRAEADLEEAKHQRRPQRPEPAE